MWNAYWETARSNLFDWVILFFGVILLVFHLYAFLERYRGQKVWAVQNLDRRRTFLLLLTELLPLAGLLGTVFGLMLTFKTFQLASDETPDFSQMVQAFAPAMSTTISGLLMVIPNLFLNGLLWLASPRLEEAHGQS